MRKIRLLAMGLGFFAAASMYAQVTFPVKVGFENADKSELYHCKYANNVGLSEFGDWVNPHTDQDNWVEQSGNDAKNGDYCFLAGNSGEKLNPWDRGIKFANLPIQEGKSYRMSFWLKGETGKVLKACISKGVDQLDKSFINPAGSVVYGLNQDQDYTIPTDEWHHVSFIAYNHGAKPFNDNLANTIWMGGAIVGDNVPESLWEGAGINESNKGKTYRDFFNNQIPEIYFAIINIYDAGNYQIDDIVIEEDKYFNQATFNGGIIKLDFGYQTNIAALAQASKRGYQKLDVNQFKVVKNGAEMVIASAEAQQDGFVYLFLSDGDAEGATISYTPAEDSPLLYGADKRPSNSSEALPVYGFESEVTYEDDAIDAECHINDIPYLESSIPADGAFDLDGNISEITLTFDITVDAENSVISLVDEKGNETQLTARTGADDKTVVIALPNKLADGNYTLNYEVPNEIGDATYDKITFSVGKYSFDQIFNVGFEYDRNNSVPTSGRLTFEGAVLTPGEARGHGARLFTDFAAGGDFTAALYSRDWDGDGQYEVGLGEEVLKIKTPGKYQLSFTWAQWKNGATMKEVTIFKVDEDGNEGEIIWQNPKAYTSAVDVNGGKGVVTGAGKEEINFIIEEAGRYGFRFMGTGEWLLANVKLLYMNHAGIKEITLADGMQFRNYTEEYYNTITYTRNFKNTEWQALYVPFAMNYEDWADDFEVARLNNVHQYDDDDNGTVDRTELEAFKVKSGKLEPNTPYMIRAKEAGEKVITLNDAILYATHENSFDVTSWSTKYTFTGTYSGISGTEMKTKGYYAIGNSGNLAKAKSESSNLGAFRWYLSVTDRNGNPKDINEVKLRVLGFDDWDDETAIEGVRGNVQTTSIFDMSGRKVNGGLRPGIYVKNGKKYVVK